jgi:hypothetical protein
MSFDALDIAGKAAKYLVMSLAILYLLDAAIFEVRRARGTAMGSIRVEQYLQTPLKGSKAEYDYLGTADEACARTLLPQYASSQWNPPCWWLQRHNAQWQ